MAKTYDQTIRDAGATSACALCFERFSEANRCWTSAGTDTSGTLHVHGVCKQCTDKLQAQGDDDKPEYTFDGAVNF